MTRRVTPLIVHLSNLRNLGNLRVSQGVDKEKNATL